MYPDVHILRIERWLRGTLLNQAVGRKTKVDDTIPAFPCLAEQVKCVRQSLALSPDEPVHVTVAHSRANFGAAYRLQFFSPGGGRTKRIWRSFHRKSLVLLLLRHKKARWRVRLSASGCLSIVVRQTPNRIAEYGLCDFSVVPSANRSDQKQNVLVKREFYMKKLKFSDDKIINALSGIE